MFNLFRIFILNILLISGFCYAETNNHTEQHNKIYSINNDLDLFDGSDFIIKNKGKVFLSSYISKLMRDNNSKVLINFKHLEDFSNIKLMENRAMEVEKHFLNSGIQIEQIEVVGFISF